MKPKKSLLSSSPASVPCSSDPPLLTALVIYTPVPDPDLSFQKLPFFKTHTIPLSFLHIFSHAKTSASEQPSAVHEFVPIVIETKNTSVSLLGNLLIFKAVGTGFCQQFSLLPESVELTCKRRIILQGLFSFSYSPGTLVSVGSLEQKCHQQAGQRAGPSWPRHTSLKVMKEGEPWRQTCFGGRKVCKMGVSRETGLIKRSYILREESPTWLQTNLGCVGKQELSDAQPTELNTSTDPICC